MVLRRIFRWAVIHVILVPLTLDILLARDVVVDQVADVPLLVLPNLMLRKLLGFVCLNTLLVEVGDLVPLEVCEPR